LEMVIIIFLNPAGNTSPKQTTSVQVSPGMVR
jgi:hypothetical protein